MGFVCLFSSNSFQCSTTGFIVARGTFFIILQSSNITPSNAGISVFRPLKAQFPSVVGYR